MPALLFTIDSVQFTEEQLTAVQQNIPQGYTLLHTGDEEKILAVAADVEICIGWFHPDWLRAMPNLQWAHQWGAGADWLKKNPDLQERPFTLTNASGVHAVQMSEHILAVMLHHGRYLHNAQRAQQAHTWARTYHPTEDYADKPFAFSWHDLTELADKTLLILGVGAIGERTAKLAQAFDMHVIGLRKNPSKTSPFVNEMVGLDQLHAVLPRADFIASTLPHTDETHHLIAAKEIKLMKPTAFLVNVGRGQTIDESALLPALQNKTIAGAALDVFETEPLPTDAPHWDLDNLLITSHYSGGSSRYHERALALFLDNLERYKGKRPLRNIVNKTAGY